MQLWHIPVRADTIGLLWAHCRDIGVFNPTSESWLLRLDLLIAFRRYGWRNRKQIAAYLLPGREDWGLDTVWYNGDGRTECCCYRGRLPRQV